MKNDNKWEHISNIVSYICVAIVLCFALNTCSSCAKAKDECPPGYSCVN